MNQSLSQLVSECFDKVAHVILQNRIITNDVDNGKMNHWFNLEHRQRPDIVQKLSRWRDEPTLPLFIEILFDEGDGSLPVLLERWSFAFIYDVRDVHRQIEVPSVYKKTIILMRALYSKALRLPTHRLHKQLCKHRLSRSRLVANVKTAPTGGVRFHAPSAAYAFGDVWSGGGCLRLSVEYRRELAALAPRPPPTEPLLISDYAGATAAAQQQQQPAHAGPALLGSLGQPRTALTGRSAPTPTHTHNSPGLALAGTTAQRSGTSDSPHSTFLVGSYPYASSPPLAPGADMFALGTSPVDSSDGASPQLLRRVSPRDPAAPSLVLSLVPTHDGTHTHTYIHTYIYYFVTLSLITILISFLQIHKYLRIFVLNLLNFFKQQPPQQQQLLLLQML